MGAHPLETGFDYGGSLPGVWLGTNPSSRIQGFSAVLYTPQVYRFFLARVARPGFSFVYRVFFFFFICIQDLVNNALAFSVDKPVYLCVY
jgi:hypothetical protein